MVLAFSLLRGLSVRTSCSLKLLGQPQLNVASTCNMHSISSVLHSLKKRQYQVVTPGVVSPIRKVPDSVAKPAYAIDGASAILSPTEPELKTKEQIEGMRSACALAATILKFAESFIKVGMTTDEVDQAVHEKCVMEGAYPSPLLYKGFPKSVCTSVNNVTCHGIPDDRKLCDGDIVNVDITVFYEGFHGDCSSTFLVGNVNEAGQRLVAVARQCRDIGIAVCRPSAKFREIGQAISKHASSNGYTVIADFCGHGIGSYFHGPPEIIHVDYPSKGWMLPGMTFTIGV